MALPRPTRFWPRLKWHDQMTISMTIMIFNIFNNGLSCPSLIADLCWFVEYFLVFPQHPLGLQWTIATIVKRLWISKISRHRYHRYHCPSRGHRGPPPIRRFAFTSTTCFCPSFWINLREKAARPQFCSRKTRLSVTSVTSVFSV